MSESYPYSCAPDTRDTVREWARERGVPLFWSDWESYRYVGLTCLGDDPSFRFLRPSDETRYVEEVLKLIADRERPKYRWIGTHQLVLRPLPLINTTLA